MEKSNQYFKSIEIMLNDLKYQFGMSNRHVCAEINLTPSYLSQMRKEGRATKDMYMRFSTFYDSVKSKKTGLAQEPKSEYQNRNEDINEARFVPFYQSLHDLILDKRAGEMQVNIIPGARSSDICVVNTQDSMEPDILKGDFLYCKKLSENDFMLNNEFYIFTSENNASLSFVKEENEKFWTIKNINSDSNYDRIEKNKVKSTYLITCIVRSF